MRELTMPWGVAILFVLTAAGQASAQTDRGPLAGGLVSAALTNDNTAASFSGFVGYRFNRAFGLGVELTSIRSLESTLGSGIVPYGPLITRVASTSLFAPLDEAESDATVFTTNVRLEVPTVSRRIVPYVTAGGGVANVNEEYAFPVYALALTDWQFAPAIFPPPELETVEYSSLFMAVTLGGGASLLWTDHVAIDVDVRCLALLGSDGRTIGRFGVGISYRF